MGHSFLHEAGRAAIVVERRLGISRREFLKLCAATAGTLGLPAGAEAAIAKAVEAAKRPSVIWLHFQECTGCSESLLRAEHPTLEKLILDVISLDYHETLMAAGGGQLFLDGALEDSSATSCPGLVNSQPLQFGIYDNGSHLKGALDDALLFNRALAPDEIAVYYNSGKPYAN